MAGLYVDYSDDGSSAPPRDAVQIGHAVSFLKLAKARLDLELEIGPATEIKENEDLNWFLATVIDDLGKKRLFSQPFIKKHEELQVNTRAWVQWAREEFVKIKQEEDAHLQKELSRQQSGDGTSKPKWMMKIRVQTPSHSLRQRVLNHWNDRIDSVQLRAT